MAKVIMGLKPGATSGTRPQGVMPRHVTYQNLLEIFGNPQRIYPEGEEARIAWGGTINNRIFVIYDYKCADLLLTTLKGEHWHIGGFLGQTAQDITQYVTDKLKAHHSVAAEKGEVIKAFHGTRAEIETFKPLSHFGTKKAAERALESVKGKGKAKIISAELTIKNPLEVKDTVGVQEDVVDWVWQAEDKGVVTEKEATAIEDIVKTGEVEEAETAFVKLLKSKGYDGLKYINQTEDKGSVSYVIFEPEQVAQPPAEPAKVEKVALSTLDELTIDNITLLGVFVTIKAGGLQLQIEHSSESEAKLLWSRLHRFVKSHKVAIEPDAIEAAVRGCVAIKII